MLQTRYKVLQPATTCGIFKALRPVTDKVADEVATMPRCLSPPKEGFQGVPGRTAVPS